MVLSTPAVVQTPQATPVGGMWASFNRFPIWCSNIGHLTPPIPAHNITLYGFAVALAQPGHSMLVALDSGFVNLNVFMVVASVHEAATILDVTPFDHTKDTFSKDHFLFGIQAACNIITFPDITVPDVIFTATSGSRG